MYMWKEHRWIREVVTITQLILPWKPLTFPKNLKTFLKAILWKCLQKGEFVLNLQITGTIVQRLMTLTLVQYIILLLSTLLSSLAMSIWHIWYSIGANGCFWQMAENTLTREVVKSKALHSGSLVLRTCNINTNFGKSVARGCTSHKYIWGEKLIQEEDRC